MTQRTHIFSGSIYEEMAGYARAVIVDDRIFVSGTVGVDFETGGLPGGRITTCRNRLCGVMVAARRRGR